ncbi:hypothetical protein J2X07_001368 [Fictibacillus barbaricus]|uniref:Uncharacterized protein n=1 Tax=Fictibacillus barbaricus TaxID=182136 RepID=A0ABU1TYX8_9BACL|nr:hypothetical protein [Fictibacillus barbaricus]
MESYSKIKNALPKDKAIVKIILFYILRLVRFGCVHFKMNWFIVLYYSKEAQKE